MPINNRPKVTPITKKKKGAPGADLAALASASGRTFHILDNRTLTGEGGPFRGYCGALIPPRSTHLVGREPPRAELGYEHHLGEAEAGRADACLDCRVGLLGRGAAPAARTIHILDHHTANPWRGWCGMLIPPDAVRLNGTEKPANDVDPVCLNEYDAARADACPACRDALAGHGHAAQIAPGTEILPPIPTEYGLARRFALATAGLQIWIYPTGNVSVLIVKNDKIESIGMHLFAADVAQIVAAVKLATP
jgi:hypothetical protein